MAAPTAAATAVMASSLAEVGCAVRGEGAAEGGAESWLAMAPSRRCTALMCFYRPRFPFFFVSAARQAHNSFCAAPNRAIDSVKARKIQRLVDPMDLTLISY